MKKLEHFVKKVFLFFLRNSILEQKIESSGIDHSPVKKILIVLRHQMGDTLCATPMIRSLKKIYPDAKIILVTKASTRWEEIFKQNNIVDEVKIYENGFENFIQLIKELREEKIDIAVVPSTVVFSVTNHLIAHYSKAKIKVGVASINEYENPAAFILNVKNHFMWETKKIHQIERNLEVIRQLNIHPEETRIQTQLTDVEKKFASDFIRNHFDSSKILVGFHPGAAIESNVWSFENYTRLANMLDEKFGVNIFISEGPDDEKYVSSLELCLKSKYPQINFARYKGELMNNAAIIEHCKLFVANDTGIMHLTSGLDVPLIALFCPGKAYQWGPIGENKFSIQSKNNNIDSIEVNQVFEMSCKILEGNSS